VFATAGNGCGNSCTQLRQQLVTAPSAMGDSDPMCTICMDVLRDGSEVVSLLCSHPYHAQCLANYSTAKGKPVDEIPCPVCHISNNDVLGRGSGSDSPTLTINLDQSDPNQSVFEQVHFLFVQRFANRYIAQRA
jgi:hypothetical protein